MTAHDPFADLSEPPLDISDFATVRPRPTDQKTADAAMKVGEAAGFRSTRPKAEAKAETPYKKPNMVKISKVSGRPTIQGEKAQLNVIAPLNLIVRFRDLQRRLGHEKAWQTLEEAVTSLERDTGRAAD